MEYTRKKCMLSSRFHPVKVESVANGGVCNVQILAQCAKKKGIPYKAQRKETIAVAGMAKLYVQDIITMGWNAAIVMMCSQKNPRR